MMKQRHTRRVLDRPASRRLLLAAMAMLVSGGAGAVTTVQTVVNGDHALCGQFLAMAKAVGVPEMSDAQLCDFRFERLPDSETKPFTALQWTPLAVADPVAMYQRMRMDNVVKGFVRSIQPPWPNLLQAAAEAAADHNLGFSTTQVQLEGKGAVVTVLKMDVVRHCTVRPEYMKPIGLPFYAIYKDSGLQQPMHIAPAPDGKQMMLWDRKGLRIPVLMQVFAAWGSPGIDDRPHAWFNQITVRSLVPAGVPQNSVLDVIYSYGTCAYNLWSKNKPVGIAAPSKGSMP